MLFAIQCLDGPDKLPTRLAHHAEHRAHLAAATVKLLVAGPLLAADGATMIGSLFIIDAETSEAAEQFNAGDPFTRMGVWQEITINRFDMRTNNR